jgi:DNA helicase-2/ATP-dependent DNA helicase PcrA
VESQARLENLEELLNVTGEFDQGAGDEDSPLQAFLGQVSLISDQDTYQEAVDRVTLMTVHTAKGLEFPVVFLAGLEEETFPHLRALEEGDSGMEEERRLCYVGITRAREQLFLSWARSREMRGIRLPRRISRFLKEVPEKLLDAPDLALGSGRYLDDEGPAIGSGRWRGASGPGRPAFSRPPRVQTARGEAAKSRVAEIGAVRAGPRAEREAEVAGRFPVGTPVTHKVFGRGTVRGVERDLVTVLFDSGKQRTLKQDFLQTSSPSTQAQPKECGDRIRHPRWGNGVVKAVDSQNVTVIFPGITVTMSHEEARRG